MASTDAQTATSGVMQDKPSTATPAPKTNSRVVAVDNVPRSALTGSTGGTGSTGTTGSSGSDMVYRITLQMDDGSSRTVIQEWAPGFRAGDRVQLVGDAIQR